MIRRLGPILLASLGPVASGRGDWLEFQDGRAVELPAAVRGAEVRLDAPGGPIRFPRSDFRRIIPIPDPPREWRTIRRPRALAGDARGRAEAAVWALGQGLTAEAEAMLRSAAEAGTGHELAARLVRRLDQLQSPWADPDLGALGVPGRFRVARGRHVVLLHQHDEAEAAERIDLLERVITSFDLLWAAQGIELRIPDHRLVSVWFRRRDDYREFLRASGASDYQATHGYYLPGRDLVVSFDARSVDDQRHGRARLDRQRLEVASAARELETWSEGRPYRLVLTGEPPRTLDREGALAALEQARRRSEADRLILDLDWRRLDLGTAAHEMVHQLSAATGLTPRREDFPEWLHEGLAMQFEVIRGGAWAGPDAVNDHRLELDRRARMPARLAPLIRDRGFGRGYDADAYARAWSLVAYLRADRPEAFLDFLRALRRPGPRRADRGVRAFRDAFGPDLEATERAWRRHVQDLPRAPQWD